jgi:uncharacterized cupredoxin-like copper-binding protein
MDTDISTAMELTTATDMAIATAMDTTTATDITGQEAITVAVTVADWFSPRCVREAQMNRHFGYIVAAFLSSLLLAEPAIATDGTVKVALTDMSSALGMGPAGRGMMRRGMMSPGQGMMGAGPGGQGWAHPGMMGRGMMGGGMMGGMMALRIDQPSVRTGAIHFDVVNWSRGMLHEMVVVAVDDPQATLPYDYSQEKVVEDQVKVMVDTGDLRPNQSHSLDITLTPGTYLLICNVPGHYAAGMVTPLTVTP